MSKSEFRRPEGTDGKGILGSDSVNPLNDLEKVALGDLDEDKLNDLAKCLFTLNNRYTLDGDFTWNTAGLINHSCNPNAQYDGKGLKIWITTIKDIKKGEEFTCDYGFGFDKDYKQFPCKCGNKNCCGYIVREESRWRINKKFAMSKKINK